MAVDWWQLLNSGLNFGSNLLKSPLAGPTLGLTGSLLDKEPGEVREARQFRRNQFSSSNALAGQFSGQIGGLMEHYQPLLAQQRQRGIEDISQRFAHAFPKTVGAQGPEFGSLARYMTDEALPREQAVMGDIGRYLVTEQGRAADSILSNSKPDPFASALAQFGGLLTARDMLGAGGNQPGGGVGLDLSKLLGQGGPGGAGGGGADLMGQLSQAVGLANTTGNTAALTALLQSGALAGQPFPIGIQASTQAGQVIQQAINAGLVESPAATQVGAGGAAAGGLSPGMAGVAGAAGLAATAIGSGYVGYQVGSKIGDALERPGQSSDFQTGAAGAGSGALAGAATGAAIGSIIPGIGTAIGALIGAFVGGIAGGFGGAGAENRREDAQTAREAAQTDAFRPQAIADAGQLFSASANAVQAFTAQTDRVGQGVDALLAKRDPGIQSLLDEMRQTLNPTVTRTAGFDDSLAGWQAAGRAFGGRFISEMLKVQLDTGRGFSPEAIAKDAEGFQSQEVGKFDPTTQRLQLHTQRFQQANALTSKLLAYLQSKGL